MLKPPRIMPGEEDWESGFLVKEQITRWQVDWPQLKETEGKILIVMNLQGE